MPSFPRLLVLASSSPHRQSLLRRLGLPFEIHAPKVDESRLSGESVTAMVQRLSALKAQTVAEIYPEALVIGSDQAAELDDLALGKPGTREAAAAQLQRVSGRTVRFLTGLCVLDAASQHRETRLDITEVDFRRLTPARIEAYLAQESALDCAGAFKSEGLGIALCERITSADPTALIGLPLIALVGALSRLGLDIP